MEKDLFSKITKDAIDAYQDRLISVLKLSPSTVKRRASSLRRFCDWAEKEGYLKENPFALPKKQIERIKVKVPRYLDKLRPSIPSIPYLGNAYKIYQSILITNYLHYAVLIIFCAALGFGFYQQFFARAPEPLAFPAEEIRPKRYLSFQGRLTDSSDNPISSQTNFVFKLYDAASGGNTLWDSGTCQVTPDQDGIFAVILGTTSGSGYTCSSALEIDSWVFSENAEVWLGVKVASDNEATPRIQVATVAYALNTETLQGFPLASQTDATPEATMGATARTVPALNPAGNLVIAASSPTLWSTSGTFAIKGQALSIVTDTGTDGNIAIDPDGTGKLNITLGGATGNQMRVTDANITGDALVSVYAGTPATGFDLLNLSSGSTETTVFSVDESGNTYAAGSLGVGTTNPGTSLDVVGGSIRTNADMYTGDLYLGYDDTSATITTSDNENLTIDPNSTGDIFFHGSTYYIDDSSLAYLSGLATTGYTPTAGEIRANVFRDGNSNYYIQPADTTTAGVFAGKVGIGTTAPAMDLDIAGNATLSGTLSLGPQVEAYAGTCDASSEGKMYYNASQNAYYYCDGSSWTQMGAGGGGLWTDQGGYIDPDTITSGSFRIYDNSGLAIGYAADPGQDNLIISGSVGIGTSGPGAKLDIVDNTVTTGKILSLSSTSITSGDVLYLANNTANNAYLIRAQAGASLSNRLTLDSSGNLKIYDTSGTYSLDLSHDGTNAVITASSGNIEIGAGGGDFLIGEAGTAVDIHFAESANIEADAGKVITMTDIGNITPDANDQYDLGSDTLRWANLYLGPETIHVGTSTSDEGTISYDTSTNDFLIDSDGDVVLQSTSGNVGIGTTAPAMELDIAGDATLSGTLSLGPQVQAYADPCNAGSEGKMYYDAGQNSYYYCNGSSWSEMGEVGGSGTANYIPKWQDSSTLTDSIIYETGSQIGIGTTNPGAKLDVVGNILVQGGGSLDVRSSGTLAIGGTTQTGLSLGRSGQSTTLAGNVQAFTLAGNITGSGSPNITGIGQFSGSTAALSSTGDALTLSGAGANINFSGAGLAQIKTAASQHLALMPGGNVGIGTTSPSALLSVGPTSQFQVNSSGAIAAVASITVSQDGDIIPATTTGTSDIGSSSIPWDNVYANNYYQGSTALGLWLDAGAYIYPANVGTGFQIADTTGNLTVLGTASFNSAGVTIDSSSYVNAQRFVDIGSNYYLDPAATTISGLFAGNVGIGTTSPAAKLAINGGLHVGGDSDPGDNNALIDGDLTVSGGNVAIGTTIDANRAINTSISGAGASTTYGSYIVSNQTSTGGVYGGLIDVNHSGTTGLTRGLNIDADATNASNTSGVVALNISGPSSAASSGTVYGIWMGNPSGGAAQYAAYFSGANANVYAGGDLTVAGGDILISSADGQIGVSSNFAFRDTGDTWLRLNTAPGGSTYADLAVGQFWCQNCVGTGDLKTTTTSTSGNTTGDVKITLNDYSFSPSVTESAVGTDWCWDITAMGGTGDPGNTTGRFGIHNGCGAESKNYMVRWRYVQASRDPEVFAWFNPETGLLNHVWRSEIEHPEILPTEPDPIPQGWIPVQATVFDKSLLARDAEELRHNYTITRYEKPENIAPEDELKTVPTQRGMVLITHPDIYFGKLEYCPTCTEQWAEIEAEQNRPSATASVDIAEWYPITEGETIETGDIVSVDKTKAISLTKSQTPYDSTLLGIISTSPSQTIGDEKFGDIKLSLAGRVPTNVSTINGPIKKGDPITSSSIPGVGMKATKVGTIVGKALEPYDNSDPNAVGKIMVFVNISWYDPDVYLTDTGDLNIEEVVTEGGEKKFVLKNAAGEIIERIGVFAEATIAELRAGLIETQELISNSLITNSLTVEDKLISPLVETEQLTADSIQATESQFGKLISTQIKTDELQVSTDATVAGTLYADKVVTREIVGLQSKFGEIITATLSAERIEGLEERLAELENQNISESGEVSQNIGESVDQGELNGEQLNSEESVSDRCSLDPINCSTDQLTSDIELSPDIEALVDEILNTSLEATPQAELDRITNNELRIIESLTVFGSTSLADTTIAGYLNIGGTMTISDNSINSLTGTLYLNSLGLGGIDILAGKIVIDEQGNMTVEGDLAVKGSLFANIIKPLEEQDLIVDLTNQVDQDEQESKFGKLLVKGIDDKIVASIDASGSAFFASLGIEADYSATESGAIIAASDNYLENGSYVPAIETNASAGIGILPAGKTEIQIYNPHVSENTLVYVVPASDTENKVLYLKAKKAQKDAEIDEDGNEITPEEKGWFKVGIDKSIKEDIKFNWWIIN